MRRRNLIFVASAVVMAALFVRLGVWQLHRLAERRARNAEVAGHLSKPLLSLSTIPQDSAAAHYRRVRFTGTYDFAHEVVLIDRVRDGAPGVYLITPLHADSDLGGDTVVLVNRGWVYAPDGMSVNEQLWREPERADGIGYVAVLERGPGAASTQSPGHARRFRWLDRAALERFVGRPIAPYDIVIAPDSLTAAPPPSPPVAAEPNAPRVPSRVAPPPLDDGPHLSYAIQWFSFALIALVGPPIALMRRPSDAHPGPADSRHDGSGGPPSPGGRSTNFPA